ACAHRRFESPGMTDTAGLSRSSAEVLQHWSRRHRLHVTARRLVDAVPIEVQVPEAKARHVAPKGAGASSAPARPGSSAHTDMGPRYSLAEIRRAGFAAVAARRVEPIHVRGSGLHRRAVFWGR